MSINTIGQAASLYQNTAKIAAEGVGSSNEDKVSFGSLIRDGVDSVVATQKKSEEMSALAVQGKADVAQVVQAVTEAELTLQTMVAVRDKVVSAYEEIMRMPI